MLGASVAPETPEYYSISDKIISLEIPYSDFQVSVLFENQGYVELTLQFVQSITAHFRYRTSRSQASIILHDAPQTHPDMLFLEQFVADRLGSIYWTDQAFSDIYSQFGDLSAGITFWNLCLST